MSSITLAFLCFIVGGIVTGITQSRYYQAVALSSGDVSSNAKVLDEFISRPARMPRANIRETRRRLQALATRQTDHRLETMRRQALAAIAFTLIAFLAILVLPMLD